MRNLTPQRRAAAIAAACAAVIPSTVLLFHNGLSSPAHFIGGLVIGIASAVSVGAFIKSRRACA